MQSRLISLIILMIVGRSEAQIDWIFPYEKDGLYGYTNTCADTITEAIFEEALETRGGLGLVKYKGKYGFINNDGKIAIKPKYPRASEFIWGIASVTKPNGKSYRIGANGKKYKYKGIQLDLHGTHRVCFDRWLSAGRIIEENGKYGFVMDKLNRIDSVVQYIQDTLPPKFDTVIAVTHQLMFVEYNSKFSFVFEGDFHTGADSVEASLDFKYDDIKFFPFLFHTDMNHEIIGVRQGDLWGFFRMYVMPRPRTPFKYLSISAMNRGPALVEYKPGRYGYVDQRGNEYFCER